MTWGEIKKQIRDLGFEDDSAMEEYASIVRNATNHAIHVINTTVVMPLKAYFKAELSTDEEEWTLPVITDITGRYRRCFRDSVTDHCSAFNSNLLSICIMCGLTML